MLPSSALLMLSGQGSAFILSFLVALQRCFCGFKNRKQTGPRSVLPAELSSWGCDKTALAAELIPLLPHSFQRPHFSTSLTTRRFCKLVIEDFLLQLWDKSHRLLLCLKATSRGAKAPPRSSPCPSGPKAQGQLQSCSKPSCLDNSALHEPGCTSGARVFNLNIS